MNRRLLAGMLLISVLWRGLADPPEIRCGYQGTVMLVNPTKLHPLSASEVHAWVTHDQMKTAFVPLKKAIEDLTKQWALGGHPLDSSTNYPMEEVELNITKYEGELPRIYSTQQAAVSLEEVQQACSEMGLADLDLWTGEFTAEQQGQIIDALCEANQPLDFEYRDKCGKGLHTANGGGFQGLDDCIANKNKDRAASLANGGKCKIWINLRRQGLYLLGSMGSVVADVPYGDSNKPLEEEKLERLLRDIDQYPHTLRYKNYPIVRDVEIKCTGYKGLPAATNQGASTKTNDQCEQTKVTSKVYCREPMDYLGSDGPYQAKMTEMVQTTLDEITKMVTAYTNFGTAGLPVSSDEEVNTEPTGLLDLRIPPGWDAFQRQVEGLIWGQFTEVTPPTPTDLLQLQRYAKQSMEWLTETTRTLTDSEISDLRLGLPGDEDDQKEVLYIDPLVTLTPVARSAVGEVRVTASIKIAQSTDFLIRWDVLPINRRNFEILDKYLVVDPQTGRGGVSLEDPTTIGQCTKFVHEGVEHYVCRDPASLTRDRGPACARQILKDGSGASACNTRLSYKPTYFEQFCEEKTQVLVSPREGTILEKCFASKNVSQDIHYKMKTGEQVLRTNCSLWFDGESIYGGKTIPQIPSPRHYQVEDSGESNDEEDLEEEEEWDWEEYAPIGLGASILLCLTLGLVFGVWKERRKEPGRGASRRLSTRSSIALENLGLQMAGVRQETARPLTLATMDGEQEVPLLNAGDVSTPEVVAKEPTPTDPEVQIGEGIPARSTDIGELTRPGPSLGNPANAQTLGGARTGTGERQLRSDVPLQTGFTTTTQSPPVLPRFEFHNDGGSYQTGSRRSKSSRRSALSARSRSLENDMSRVGLNLVRDLQGVVQGDRGGNSQAMFESRAFKNPE